MQPNEPEQTQPPQAPPQIPESPAPPAQPVIQEQLAPEPAQAPVQPPQPQPIIQPQPPVPQPVAPQPVEQPQPAPVQEVPLAPVPAVEIPSQAPGSVQQQPIAPSLSEQPEAVQPQPSPQLIDEVQEENIDDDQTPSELPLTEPVTWQAAEYIQQDKNPLWYVFFTIVVVVLMGVAIWLAAWTFVVLIPIMAVALVVYTHRPPRQVGYAVSEKGLYINDQLHPMGEFKSFGVLPDSELHALMLVPVKRFRPGTTLYFPDEVGEQLVDMLGAYLPMQELHVDAVDKIIRKLRI